MDQKNETEIVEAGHSDDKQIHFSQLNSLHDYSLSQLRDHIKKVMIPMLIKTFQYQLDVSAEEEEAKKVCFKETHAQLQQLDRDLHTLEQWVQNCRLQIQKGLSSGASELWKKEGIEEGKQPLQSRLSALCSESKATPWWRGLLPWK